jgi:LysR family transcriptional regulator, nitrogen assimilation regulatory protein
LDIRQIRTFVHIAEFQSFTRASTYLHISQPALSRQIRLLEAELGLQLFRRHGHGAELTSDGVAFLKRCAKVLSEFETLKTAFTSGAPKLNTTGKVGIGCPVPASRFLTGSFIAKMRDEHSGVSLRIVEGFSALIHEWLISGSIDLAFLYGTHPGHILTSELLLHENLYAIGAPTPYNKALQSITMAELVRSPLILDNKPHVARRLVEPYITNKTKVIEVSALSLILELARQGQGYGILPSSAVAYHVASNKVVAIPIVEPSLNWEVSICYSTLRPLSDAAELVLDAIRAEVMNRVKSGDWAATLAPKLAELGE